MRTNVEPQRQDGYNAMLNQCRPSAIVGYILGLTSTTPPVPKLLKSNT